MDLQKRLENLAKKTKSSRFPDSVHYMNGRAIASDGYMLFSTPTNHADCNECGFDHGIFAKINGMAQETVTILEVSLYHLDKAVKLGCSVFSGRNLSDKRESSGNRILEFAANGNLEISGESEYGRTTTQIKDGEHWNLRWLPSKGSYKTAPAHYKKAGEDTTARLEGDKLHECLMLMKDTGAEVIEIEFWQAEGFPVSAKLNAGDISAVICGCFEPEVS